ncbi:hypothetical protein M5K25_025241 [Dendrobium thyrsiflorum]|uniref:Uncharacterized protein n=1 Tax=Dendrobium thyrsiflorum TaxID=117978 RepID=A0ABD0U420_DENTH
MLILKFAHNFSRTWAHFNPLSLFPPLSSSSIQLEQPQNPRGCLAACRIGACCHAKKGLVFFVAISSLLLRIHMLRVKWRFERVADDASSSPSTMSDRI